MNQQIYKPQSGWTYNHQNKGGPVGFNKQIHHNQGGHITNKIRVDQWGDKQI